MSAVTAELVGVLPVVQTPFDAADDIDLDALAAEIDWILGRGVRGITVGMVSEILRLSIAERRRLTEAVCQAARPRNATVVIACGTESTRTAVDLATHAAASGATAVMAAPPATIAVDDDALFGYFAEIVEQSTIPLVVQDASGYVGRPLSMTLQVRLLEAFGDTVYFKPEAPPIGQRLSQLRDCTDGRARIFEGTGGAALVDSFRRGVVGTMPGAEVCWAVQALWTALTAGDWETAYRISGPLTSLVSLQSGLDGFVLVEKHLLVRQGVLPSPRARGPLSFRLDPETADEVDRLCDLLSTVVDSIGSTT